MSKYKLDLQLFAEGDGGGAGDGSGAGAEGTNGNNQGGEGSKEPRSFDDFLAQEGNQAEFDRRVQKAVNTAVGNAQAKWKTLTDDKLSEAEKLAQMTESEKAEYLRNKERREFEEEKAKFEQEKLLIEVQKELQEKSLPLGFAESLATIMDAEKIKTAITDIKKVWDAEISEAIKAKARQTPPHDGGGTHAGGRSRNASIAAMAKQSRIIK